MNRKIGWVVLLVVVIGVALYFVWQTGRAEETEIKLYYYNPELDKDEADNIMCSEKGLVPVVRTLSSKNVIEDTIALLIKGELTEEERKEGLTTEYPLEGFNLVKTELKDGVLTLTFEDPNNKTSGGSCRVNILWSQIAKTAKQFPQVQEVRFLPEELFQP